LHKFQIGLMDKEGDRLIIESLIIKGMLSIAKNLLNENTGAKVHGLVSAMSKRIKSRTLKKSEQIEKLTEAYKQGSLVLVLGAGISKQYNVPDWNTLLQKLFLYIYENETQSNENQELFSKICAERILPSPLIAARSLSRYYQDLVKNEGSILAFEMAVKNAIYENIKIEDTETLNEIRKICMASRDGAKINSIITYNYDDIIENILSRYDIPYKVIYSQGMHAEPHHLPIYHVHGFLPRQDSLDERNKIILSEEVYHQQYQAVYSWNNLVQINKFTDYTCLFIGTSFTDPNLRRVLDISKGQRTRKETHYIIAKTIDCSTLDVPNNEEGLVNDLETFMEEFYRKDYEDFSVSPIWVDSYEEISDILKTIRCNSIHK